MNREDVENIGVMWGLTGGAVLVMVVRLAMRWSRLHKFELGDYFTMAAVCAILLRSSVETVAISWGTNQLSAADRAKGDLASWEIYHREIGAKMTMVNRVFYTVYIWLQKCVVMCVVQQLLKGLGSYMVLKLYWIAMAITFVGALIPCFVECSPFHFYWQVVPDPGTCAAGSLQLLVFSILEILTDVMLMVLPLRQLAKIQRPWLARLRLISLFMVGTTIMAVTLARLLMNRLKYHRSGASHDIANVEIFFAAFVANAPPLYGLFNLKYGTSSKRSRSLNTSRVQNASQQLDDLSPSQVSALNKRQQGRLGSWTSVTVKRKTDHGDSDEELIVASRVAS